MARPRKNKPVEHTKTHSAALKRVLNIINCASCSKQLTQEEMNDPDRLCAACRAFVTRNTL